MVTRRHAMKLTLGSFVAALPLGPRAVAAIPADLDPPAVEMLDTPPTPAFEAEMWMAMFIDAYDGPARRGAITGEFRIVADGTARIEFRRTGIGYEDAGVLEFTADEAPVIARLMRFVVAPAY